MTAAWFIAITAILVLLIISAFFSGSETALTAASRPRIHQLAKQGNLRAQTVLDLYDRKDRLISAILLGNNIVNILASVLATYVLLLLYGDAGLAYASNTTARSAPSRRRQVVGTMTCSKLRSSPDAIWR